ncbi:MAG TPA: TCP-1/cpn60 chaperonin family protein [Bacilli bacterium]
MAMGLNLPKEASKNLITGVKKVYDIIKNTIGPMGDNVILDPALEVTKEGLRIAQAITLANPYENIGAKIATKLASDVYNEVHDGTKTAIILLANILFGAEKYYTRGYSGNKLNNAFGNVKNLINEYFQKQIQPVTDLDIIENVALTASSDSEISTLIRNLYENGIDTLNKSFPLTLNSGFLSYQMINDRRNQNATFQDVDVVIVYDYNNLPKILNEIKNPSLLILMQYKIENVSLINKFLAYSDKEVVAIYENEKNKILEIAKYCECENVDGNLVGHVEKVVVTENKTTIINNNQLAELHNANNNIIANDRLQRFQKALSAVSNATSSGVILGEGIGLLNLRDYINKQDLQDYDRIARDIIYDAMEVPYQLIINNAGLSNQFNTPYDFKTNTFIALDNFKVYDPIKEIMTIIDKVISYVPLFIQRNILITNI